MIIKLIKSYLNFIIKQCLAATVVYYVYYKRKCFYRLRKFGYDGPQPSFIKFGNLLEFYSKENSIGKNISLPHYSKTLYRWSLKYGKIYVYYEMTQPVLVISNADLVKHIFVDHQITTRRPFPMSPNEDNPTSDIFLNNGNRWKRVQKCLQKQFLNKNNIISASRILHSVFECTFLNKPQIRVTKRFDIYKKLKATLVNVMFQTLFGMDLNEHLLRSIQNISIIPINTQSRINYVNTLLSRKLAKKFDSSFSDFESVTALKILSLVFNEFDSLWKLFDSIRLYLYFKYDLKSMEDPVSWFTKHFTIKQHKYLLNNVETCENLSLFKSILSCKDNCLTHTELISNGSLMMFAGFETTSTAIAFACHVLLNNEEERLKILNEMHQHIGCNILENEFDLKNEKMLFDTISKLNYLDLFIKEVLRMYPIGNSMVSRRCIQENIFIGNDKEYFIPTGTNIVIDVLSIHYNKHLWGPVDPFIFYPNRFLEKRHPAAWLPFGTLKKIFKISQMN